MAENLATWGEAREHWIGMRPMGITSAQARMLQLLLDEVMEAPVGGEVRVKLVPGQRKALRGVLDEVERITTKRDAA